MMFSDELTCLWRQKCACMVSCKTSRTVQPQKGCQVINVRIATKVMRQGPAIDIALIVKQASKDKGRFL